MLRGNKGRFEESILLKGLEEKELQDKKTKRENDGEEYHELNDNPNSLIGFRYRRVPSCGENDSLRNLQLNETQFLKPSCLEEFLKF